MHCTTHYALYTDRFTPFSLVDNFHVYCYLLFCVTWDNLKKKIILKCFSSQVEIRFFFAVAGFVVPEVGFCFNADLALGFICPYICKNCVKINSFNFISFSFSLACSLFERLCPPFLPTATAVIVSFKSEIDFLQLPINVPAKREQKYANCFEATGWLAMLRFHKAKKKHSSCDCLLLSGEKSIRNLSKELPSEASEWMGARAIWHQFRATHCRLVLRLEFRLIWIWIENFSNGIWNAISHSSDRMVARIWRRCSVATHRHRTEPFVCASYKPAVWTKWEKAVISIKLLSFILIGMFSFFSLSSHFICRFCERELCVHAIQPLKLWLITVQWSIIDKKIIYYPFIIAVHPFRCEHTITLLSSTSSSLLHALATIKSIRAHIWKL